MEKITSRTNPLLGHFKKLLRDRSYRRACGEYVGDGVKLLEEAIRWQAPLTAVLLTEDVVCSPLPQGVRRAVLPFDVMASVSPMKAPQGALFSLRQPDLRPPAALEGSRYLILDGLQDPGNVGTIWRTADAFGADGLLLTGHCADPLGWKAVRASMGAAFRLPVWEAEYDALLPLLERSGLPLYATALREDTVALQNADLSRCAVAIGSEGHGVSDRLLNACRETVKIPMEPQCESLNAATAAAVVLWEWYRSDAGQNPGRDAPSYRL
ncbi:MAG: RNA methyltransferase [Clostridiales bacterium]|nr:RNA methyltransferase [Clostridiales bacterium]